MLSWFSALDKRTLVSGAFAIAALFMWWFALSPDPTALTWKSGAPLSKRARVLAAVFATALWLATAGAAHSPALATTMFAVAMIVVIALLNVAQLDQERHFGPKPPLVPMASNVRLAAALALVGATFFAAVSARGLFSDVLQTDEQRALRALGYGLFVACSGAGLVLFRISRTLHLWRTDLMNPLFRALVGRGWSVRLSTASTPAGWSRSFTSVSKPLHYPEISPEAAAFLSALELCNSADGSVKFRTREHFATSPDPHFPFLDSGQNSLALRARDGAVVRSNSAEPEAPAVVASSFAEFLSAFTLAASSERPAWPYSLFLAAPGGEQPIAEQPGA